MYNELISIIPKEAKSLSDLRIEPDIVSSQIIKELYIGGKTNPRKLARKLKLSVDIVNNLVNELKKQEIVGMVGGTGIADDYLYGLYPKGVEQAKNLLTRDKYLGPAPVSIEEYIRVTKSALKLSLEKPITRSFLNTKFENIIGYKDILFQIGQVASSRKPAFVYGFPGNGKTHLCSSVAETLSPMIVPYAVEVGTQLVRIFDPSCHKILESVDLEDYDQRWVVIAPPMIVTGGELTLDDLEVKYNKKYGCYDAPPQVKATGGVLLIDDLGRQRCTVEEIFNRLIIPLENKVDYLVLGGQRLEVPANEIILFSTNIDPSKIVDDAFLRRLPYKINVRNPRLDEFSKLWEHQCGTLGLVYSASDVEYLMTLYERDKRGIRAVHPRDLLSIVGAQKKYLEEEDKNITQNEIEDAYGIYFVTELKLVE
jgi:predicted ATPase with chaperone activity